jgi:acyl carrier protein
MRENVLHVISQVLGMPVDELSEDSSPENIEAWDSLKHMNLVLALEEEFGVRFSDEKIVEMLNVRLITEAVQELLPQAKSASQR